MSLALINFNVFLFDQIIPSGGIKSSEIYRRRSNVESQFKKSPVSEVLIIRKVGDKYGKYKTNCFTKWTHK